LIFIYGSVSAQEIMRFEVLSGDIDRLNCPVSVSLEQVDYNTDEGELILFEVGKGQEQPIPCQIENGHRAKLWFLLSGNTARGEMREFVMRKGEKTSAENKIELLKDHGDMDLQMGGKAVLSYRFSETYPPDSINPIYRRSGYIHPVVSPEGEVLTRIQPPDHYHHYGIWGPWTKTHIKGREVDFWNLAKGQGTVRFLSFLSEVEGDVFSGFRTLQKHLDFGAGEDQTAINEVLDVRVWNVGTKVWLLDYTTTINCPLDSGILFDAYRYGGGIGFRATEKWTKNNSSVLTSSGKTRKDADGTNARWCIIEGESDTYAGRSGILFMSHPSNRMHPEPMRVWPLNANNGRGDMFFEFCPIRHVDWVIEKGTDYTLKYRLLVFDGKITAEEAESYWQIFANPLEIKIDNAKPTK